MSLAPWAGSLEERAVEVQCNQRFFTLNQPSDKHTTIATLYTLFRPVWHTSSHTRPRLPACLCASSARVAVSGDVACVMTEREDVLISSTLRLFRMPSLPTGLHAGSCAQSPPQRSPRRVPTMPNPFWDDQLFPSLFLAPRERSFLARRLFSGD